MLKSGFFRKIPAAWLVAVMVMGLAACNTEIKIPFEYNAQDYIQLGEYKGIAVEVDTTAVANSLIEERINNDLEDVTEYNEVTRGAAENDQLTLIFTATIGGISVDGFSSDEYKLVLGKDDFIIPGFTDALYDMKAGDTKIVTLTVPEGIQDAEVYANKRIVYEIQMAKVEQPIVPMLTDAYAKEYFGFDTLQEYRESIASELQETITENTENARKQAVLEALQERCEVKNMPEELLASKKTELDNSIKFYATMYGMSVDEYCRDRYHISFEEYVRRSAAQDLIIQAIAQKEELKVTEYEYKGDLKQFASDNGYSDEQAFVEKFGKEKIVKSMLLQKAIDVVMDSAVITEK